MAVSTTNAVSGPYVANGVTTVFPFTFKAMTTEEIGVKIVVDGDGAVVPDTDYVTTISSLGGGNITFSAAPTAGQVYIYSDPKFTQETGFSSGQPFSPSVVNEALDRAAIRDQSLKEDLGRSFRVPIGESVPEVPNFTGNEGRLLGLTADRELYWATAQGDDGAFRADAGASGGTQLIGGPANRSLQYYLNLLASNALTPESYGAVGDGAYTGQERDAMDAVKADAIALGKPILLTGRYNVGDGFWGTGAVTYIGQGEDPRLLGAVILDAGARVIGRPVEVDYERTVGMATTRRRDTLTPLYKEPFALKSLWLGPGDQLHPPEHVAIDPASLILSINDFPGGDAWTIGNHGAVSATGIGFVTDTDLRWYQAGVPLHGGMEITMSTSGSDLNRGVVVNCTSGTFGLYAADFNAGSWFWKPTGGAIQTGTVNWDGVATHQSWIGRYLLWTLRLYDHETIGVLVNGTEVYRFTLPSGHIVRGGFIGMRTAPNGGIAMEWPIASRIRTPQGGPVIDAYLLGDSKTETHQGDWADALRVALDGSAGVRVRRIVNRAVSGQNSLDQLNVLTANPPAGMTDVIIPIATNDIQAGATAEVTRANLTAMLVITDAAGIARSRVHIGIPDLWYTPALAGGFGEVTANYQGGSRTRAAMMNWAASQGCSIVNMPQVLGPVLGSQITAPDASDARMRDNIHPTVFAYRLMGMEFARSVLRQAAREMRRAVPRSVLPGAFQNGWTAGTRTPCFTMTEEGECQLSGNLLPGTKADGTTIYTLPMNLWPRETDNFPLWIGGGSFGMVEVSSVDGTLKIYGADAGINAGLSAVRFQTRSLFG